jgi:DNA polymerase-3 subunit delta'
MAEESGSRSPPPRANPDLLGHEAAERALRHLFATGRLPHAVLITGARGIGKATLAYRLARFVLAYGATESGDGSPAGGTDTLAVPPACGVFRRVASGGHADLLAIERAYDPRRRRLRGEILVDDVRDVAVFLRRTPAEGGWRVVIIDGADDMNRSAANALLKILEEPPRRALLLLVAHHPGRLLPTICSRCRRLALAPLPPALLAGLLATYRPDLPRSQTTAVIALAGGSIGHALELIEADGIELYRTMLGLLSRVEGLDAAALHALADRLARGEADSAYRAVEELLSHLLGEIAIRATGAVPGRHPDPEAEAALRRLGDRAPAVRWVALREQVATLFARCDTLNLDRKQTILGAFFAIERVAR